MNAIKLSEEQWVDVTLDMQAIDLYTIFLGAYAKLVNGSGLPVGEISPNEEKLTIHYKGRMDNLSRIWYVTGALMERAATARNSISKN